MANIDRWRQFNNGDRTGEIVASRNVDTHTSPGKLKLARPFTQVATAAQIGNNQVEAFCMYRTDAYALTSATLYKASTPFTSWSSVDTTPASAQDMVVYDDQIVITTNDDLDAYNATGPAYTSDWWTSAGGAGLQDSSLTNLPHILHADSRIKRIFVTDGQYVRAYLGDISGGGTFATLTLPEQFTSTCIKTAIRKTWVGTFTEDDDQAYVFEWDGGSSDATDSFPVGAKAVLAMEMIDNVPLIVTERGEIKMFNNAGFTTVAQFPFTLKPSFADGVETANIQNNNTSRPVHPKGMRRAGNVVYIFVNFESTANDRPVDYQTHAGVWAYDLTTRSLTHLGAPENEANFQNSSPIMLINDENTRIFVGGRRNTSADEEGIWIEDLSDTNNYGYVTTVELDASEVLDVWDAAYLSGRLEGGSAVLKCRVEEKEPFYLEDAVWASATQFNTTTDLSSVSVGDEIEIVLGTNAGRLAHITAIESSTNTYAVTIDESIGTATETCDMWITNFVKIGTYSSGSFKKLGPNKTGTFIQYKLELRGSNGYPEIRRLLSHSNKKHAS